MDNPKLTKLKDMMNLLNEGLTKTEFANAFKEVINYIKRVEQNLFARLDVEIAKVRDGKDGRNGVDGQRGPKGDRGERGLQGIPGFAVFGARGTDGKDGKNGKDGSPDTPGQVRDKLETLTGNERLDISAIKGIDEIKKELSAKIDAIPKAITPRSSNATKFYSLTADGSTKIFKVPKSVAAIVLCSDFPTVLMENAGFTINASRTQITLTTANAPSNGAQLLYQYSSMFN